MDREERNRRMRENRALLREAGFSAKDADRLKNASPATIQRMIESGKAPKKRGSGGISPADVVPGKIYRYGGKAESKDERNKRLRQTKELLLAAGISKEDANRLRNASPETIKKILETGKAPEKRHFYLRAKKEHMFSVLPWVQAKRNYTNRYNVVLQLLFVRPGNQYKTKYITVQADFELSREDIMEAGRDIVAQTAEQPTEGSDWKLADMRIVGCFMNPDIPERPRPESWRKYKGR